MNAPFRRLWDQIMHLPVLDFLARRETIPQPPEATDDGAFRFKDCEDDCGPLAEEVEAKEHERAEQFKRDQFLPIMGWSTGAPGWIADVQTRLSHMKNKRRSSDNSLYGAG